MLREEKPTKWGIKMLRDLVKMMNRPQITTSEALCARIMDDKISGVVLHRLLQWQGTGKDGTYKSDRAFYAEEFVTYDQMKRVRTIFRRTGIMEIVKKKVNGAPTMHYLLNAEKFLERIAAVFKRPLTFMRVLIFDRVENGNSGKSGMDSGESPKSITTGTTTSSSKEEDKQQQQPTGGGGGGKNISLPPKGEIFDSSKLPKTTKTFDILRRAGISTTAATQYQWIDAEDAQVLVDSAQKKYQDGRLETVPARYIVGALKKIREEEREQYAIDSREPGMVAGTFAEHLYELATIGLIPARKTKVEDSPVHSADDLAELDF